MEASKAAWIASSPLSGPLPSAHVRPLFHVRDQLGASLCSVAESNALLEAAR